MFVPKPFGIRRMRKGPSELSEQMRLAEHLDSATCDGRPVLWAHVPNEGKRDSAAGAHARRSGLKEGVPDCLIFSVPRVWAVQGIRGIALELKTATGVTSDAQRDWIDRLQREQWLCGVVYGWQQGVSTLQQWGYVI